MYFQRLRGPRALSTSERNPLALLTVWLAVSAVAVKAQNLCEPSTRCHAVAGTVVNALTAEPIARALVTVVSDRENYAMTDGNGSFRFENVPEGMVTLTAERPGFLNADQLRSESNEPSDVKRMISVVSDVDAASIALVPQAVIEGHITSTQGSAIVGFPVRLYRRSVEDGRERWQLAKVTLTDDDGYFRIPGQARGAYCLSVGPELWRPSAVGTRQLGYPYVFYPNAPDVSGSCQVSLGTGQQLEADFRLSREPVFEISGQLVGVPPTADARIRLISHWGDIMPIRQPDPGRNEFLAHAPSGQYTLWATAQEGDQKLETTFELNVTSDTSGIVVVMQPPSVIPVNVRIEKSDGSKQQPAAQPVIRLVSAAETLLPSVFAGRTVGRGEQRGIEFQGVMPGRYFLDVRVDGYYVISAMSGSTNLLTDELLVSSAGASAPVEIVLSDNGGRVGGTVRLNGHASATALLIPEGGAPYQIRTADVSADGNFAFSSVRPGGYAVLAFDRMDRVEYRNPQVLNNYLAGASRVGVLPHQEVRVDLGLAGKGD